MIIIAAAKSPGYERQQPVDDIAKVGGAELVQEVLGPGVGEHHGPLARPGPRLQQRVARRHVGVAADKGGYYYGTWRMQSSASEALALCATGYTFFICDFLNLTC